MPIDYAYILSAGKGTRMGEIGKVLPKPLWPIFSKTLLELQIKYCQDLGIKKIYINTHYLGEKIKKLITENPSFKDVIILEEEPLLDSGGAIHNLAQRSEVNYSGNVFIINADQFYLFDEKEIWSNLEKLKSSRAVLFGIEVTKEAHYNELVLENGFLQEIIKTRGIQNYTTYSGNCLLRLDGLRPVEGISKFFESVTNFKNENEKIEVVNPLHSEYWDFGTFDLYCQNIFKLYQDYLDNKTSRFQALLKKSDVFTAAEKFINLEQRAIDLDCKGQFVKGGVVKSGLTQLIN